MDSSTHSNLLHYLQTLEYPSLLSVTDQQKIAKLKSHYFETQNKLYHRKTQKQVPTQEEAKQIFQFYHLHPLGGHFAFHNTLDKIKQVYHWETMHQDLQEWISTCDRCQRKGKENFHESAHSIPVPILPFAQVAMDIKHVSPSRGDHRYIIVAIDYLTKWTEARALVQANAIEVYQFFVEDVICRHSTPHTIITDNGSPFNNLLIDSLCNQFVIKHKYSSAYHPQGNGLVERFNRSLGHCLMMLPNEEKEDWHVYLEPILFSYRTITQASIKMSPFEALYGYFPSTMINNLLGTQIEEPSQAQVEDYFSAIKNRLEGIRRQAHDYLVKAQSHQRKVSNKKLKTSQENKPPFLLGDLVLRYQDAIAGDLGEKIQDRYAGPYIVQQAFANGTYLLKTIHGKLVPRHVHGNKLKIYKNPTLSVQTVLPESNNESRRPPLGPAPKFRPYLPPTSVRED